MYAEEVKRTSDEKQRKLKQKKIFSKVKAQKELPHRKKGTFAKKMLATKIFDETCKQFIAGRRIDVTC